MRVVMKYIVVNDRTPFVVPKCCCCSTQLTNGYVRHFLTGLYMCPVNCVAFIEKVPMAVIEDKSRRVKCIPAKTAPAPRTSS